MEKEFNLSEKEIKHLRGYWREEDIKEFIKRRNGLLFLFLAGDITKKEFMKEWNKLAGEKLI